MGRKMSNKVVKISDKQTALKVVSDDYEQFQCCSEELKNDWDVVLAAVKKYGPNLEYASSDMQANEEIVKAAINENGEALKFASDELRAKKSIVLKAIQNDGHALKYASDKLRSDRSVVFKAVKYDGRTLKYASNELRSMKGIVLKAVRNKGYALKYASDELRSMKSIVLKAIQNNGYALKYASDKLRADRSIVCKAVMNDGLTIKYASDELKNDLDVVYIAIKNNPEAIFCVPEHFKKDKKLHALLGKGSENSDFLNAMSCSEFFKLWLKDNASRFNYPPIEVEFERDFARYRFENITNAIELTLSGYGDVNLAIYDENLNLLDFLGWLEVSPVKVADNYWACDLCTAFNPTSEENIYIDINHLYSQHLCEERILENCNHLFQPDKFLVYYQHMKFKSIWHVDLQSLNEFDPHDEDILKYHSILSSNSCLI